MLLGVAVLLWMATVSEGINRNIYKPMENSMEPNCTVVEETSISATDQEAIVEKHNQLRASVNSGNVKFQTLVWNDTLAGRAQLTANTCELRENYTRYCPTVNTCLTWTVGQNRANGNTPTVAINFETLVQQWWDTGSSYTFADNSCSQDGACDPFLKMAWQNSHEIGCGFKRCSKLYAGSYDNQTESFAQELDDHYFFVCNYFPNNREGEQPYSEIGCNVSGDERSCNGQGSFDDQTCTCNCSDGYYGKWCEFTDGTCLDDDCDWWLPIEFCFDPELRNGARDWCPLTCGCCPGSKQARGWLDFFV